MSIQLLDKRVARESTNIWNTPLQSYLGRISWIEDFYNKQYFWACGIEHAYGLTKYWMKPVLFIPNGGERTVSLKSINTPPNHWRFAFWWCLGGPRTKEVFQQLRDECKTQEGKLMFFQIVSQKPTALLNYFCDKLSPVCRMVLL